MFLPTSCVSFGYSEVAFLPFNQMYSSINDCNARCYDCYQQTFNIGISNNFVFFSLCLSSNKLYFAVHFSHLVVLIGPKSAG